MSHCATHGELVGGYVLGALEPAEMEEMHRHVSTCRTCGPEVRRLTVLPDLLNSVEQSDVPPPTASPELEEAILDRFARERGRAARPRRLPRVAAVAAALAAACVALALALVLGEDEEDAGPYATARLMALEPGSSARASASVDAVPAGTRVTLGARGLDGHGAVYQLWCVRPNGSWVSGGSFHSSADGRARAQLTAAVKPGDYHVIVVTRTTPGSPEGARGTAILRGELRY